MKSRPTSTKVERKTIEKNRRIHMRSLCFKLASHIPSHHPKESLSQQDQLERATNYIKKLQAEIAELKEQRDLMMGGMKIGLRLPMVEVRDLGSSLEVLLISDPGRKLMSSDVISLLEEEGVSVVSASFSFTGDKVIHVIHSQVTCSRVDIESGRLHERLKELVY